MSRPNLLVLAIQGATSAWPPFDTSGDPNLIDVYHVANSVTAALKTTMPTRLPDKEQGVGVVEVLESTLLRGDAIRNLSLGILSDRCLLAVQRIKDGHLLDYLIDPRSLYDGAAGILTSSLYAWHGCLNMAKTLRPTYVTPDGDKPYTLEIRKSGYDYIAKCAGEEAAKGNPLVKFGVTLARDFSVGRKNQIIDDWVPKESAYWS
jgi:hypothetical protein